jgi:hypothetical protein
MTGLSTIGRQAAFSDQVYMVESAESCVEVVNREMVYILRKKPKPGFVRQLAMESMKYSVI